MANYFWITSILDTIVTASVCYKLRIDTECVNLQLDLMRRSSQKNRYIHYVRYNVLSLLNL